MYELGNLFTCKFVGTGPPSYEKRTYCSVVSRRSRNIGVWYRNIALIHKVKRYLRKKRVMAKCISLSEVLCE
jgi:hypothetical protein